ncbi:MAG: hypothetical protein WB297_05360 [Actinomycetota bacterium]
MASGPPELARMFVNAIAAKDRTTLTSVLDPQIDFRGLTPSYEWRATTPEEVAEVVLGNWFEPTDHVREVLEVRVEPFADRHHLWYRFKVENDDGMHVVEQQSFLDAADGRITRMSVVCSGFRLLEEQAGP